MRVMRHPLNALVLIACSLPLTWAAACATSEAPPAPAASARTDIFLKPDTELIRGLVPRHTTLDGLLRSHGLASDAVQRVIAATRTSFDPRRLRASQPFVLLRTIEGELRRFEYEIDNDSFLRIDRALPARPQQQSQRLAASQPHFVLEFPRQMTHRSAFRCFFKTANE